MSSVQAPKESDLYAPIKTFLEGQGYEVKSEVAGADVVACRGDEPPVIVEMKTGFSLALFHQGVARLSLTDAVYLAVPSGSVRGRKAFQANVKLARRLGLGVMTVRARDGFVEVLVDPGPYAPRQSSPRKGRLLREFQRRVGDPNTGGINRTTLMTAYRQDALRCLAHLAHGEARGRDVKEATGVPNATRILADDHYGWFERVRTGVYQTTPKGRDALGTYKDEIAAMGAEQ